MSSEERSLAESADQPERATPVAAQSSSAVETTTASDTIDTVQAMVPAHIVRVVARWLLVFATIGGIGWIIWHSWSALLPFQVGFVIAYLTLPVVNRLEDYMPRWAAILLVYLGGIILILLAIAFVVPPLIDQLQGALANLREQDISLDMFTELFANFEAFRASLPADAQTFLDETLNEAWGTVRTNLTSYIQATTALLVSSTIGIINTFTFVFGFLVVPFWLFYVLKDEEAGLVALDKLLFPKIRADFWAVMTIIDRVFSSYIRGQLFLGFIVFMAVWVGLTGLQIAGFDIQYALLLAVIAGSMELIPFIGPILGAIPSVAAAAFISPQAVIAVLILFIIIQQLENNFLVPRVVGESVDIHPAILMMILLAMSQFGFIWIVLAAPLAAIVRDIFLYGYGRLSNPPRPAGALPNDVPGPSSTTRHARASGQHESAVHKVLNALPGWDSFKKKLPNWLRLPWSRKQRQQATPREQPQSSDPPK